MGIHIVFIFLYFGLAQAFPAEVMDAMLIGHCVISIISDLLSGKKLYIMSSFYVGVILATAANLLYVYKVHTNGVSEYSMYKYIIPQYIDEATLVWCVGNSFIFMGYQIFKKRSLPSIRIDIQKKNVLTNVFYFSAFFSLLSITGNAINLNAIGGGVAKVLSLLGIGGILFYARLWGKENTPIYRTYALSLWGLYTFSALVSSFLRADLLSPAFSLFVGFFLGKGSSKYLFSYRIIPAILVIVIFSQFFQTLGGNRSHFISTFTSSSSDDENAQASNYTTVVAQDDGGGALERSSNIAQMTNVVNLTKKNGFYGGQASLPLLAAIVPRIIWPDKPIIQLGAWFALEIGVASITDAGRANNSINMTIPGELYLDFGWIGLGLGCILFGGLLALFWNGARFYESPYNITGTLWAGYLLLYSIVGMGADLQIVISLISTYIVLLIFKKIVSKNEYPRLRPSLEGK